MLDVLPVARAAHPPSLLLRTFAIAIVLVSGLGLARTWALEPGDPWPALEAGDRVLLAPGTYEGPWAIEVPEVVVEANDAVLQGPADGSALILAAPGIVVRGLTVRDAGRIADLYAPDAAAWLMGCDRCVLDGLETRGTPGGLRIEASRDVQVLGGTLDGGPEGPGVTAYQAPDLRLSGLSVRGFLDGVYVERSDRAQLHDLLVVGAERYGLHVMFSAGVTIENASVRGGGVGSAVMYGMDARIVSSRFEDHQGPLAYGLLLHEMHGVEVDDLVLDRNTIGALVVSSPDVSIQGATFARSGTGLLVRRTPEGDSSAVVVLRSRFSGNVGDVAVDDPDASVRLHGNAYDAASPLDRDRDGISDVAYLPTSSFALLATRTPDLSLFAFQPGVTMWERAEAAVPALRLATLHDASARPLSRDGQAPSFGGRVAAALVVIAAVVVGVAARGVGGPRRPRRSPA